MCTIYDIHSQKNLKTIPDEDMYNKTDYESKEFLACCFGPQSSKSDNKTIITLTGEPDWMLILWNWDTQKMITKINIGITGVPFSINEKGPDIEPEYNFQVSFDPSEPTCVIVTGIDTYRYLRIEEGKFNEEHTQVNIADRQISTKYTCHTWLVHGGLIVCTENGEIFLCEDGAFKCYIPESPVDENLKIEACIPFT